MCYTPPYETTDLCASVYRRRTTGPQHWAPLVRCLCAAPLPDAPRQCARPACSYHCRQSGLRRPNRPQCDPRLQYPRTRHPHPRLIPALDRPADLRCSHTRALTRDLAPEPAQLRQAHQHLDTRPGRRGQLCRAPHPASGQWRNHSPGVTSVRNALEARQALDYQPRSRLRQEKKQRDRLIRLAIRQPSWAVGFADEVWWSRLAEPDLHTWQDEGQVTQLYELARAKDDADPKALACYGMLLRRRPQHADHMLMRFVKGRPVSALTTDFLAWCCERLACQGVRALLLIWDNASWHTSQQVRSWVRQHNQ